MGEFALKSIFFHENTWPTATVESWGPLTPAHSNARRMAENAVLHGTTLALNRSRSAADARAIRLLALASLGLAQRDPWTTAISIDELHPCGLEHAADGLIIDPGELGRSGGELGAADVVTPTAEAPRGVGRSNGWARGERHPYRLSTIFEHQK